MWHATAAAAAAAACTCHLQATPLISHCLLQLQIRSIACGPSTFAVAADSSVITWGAATNGELGYGTSGKKSSANPDKVGEQWGHRLLVCCIVRGSAQDCDGPASARLSAHATCHGAALSCAVTLLTTTVATAALVTGHVGQLRRRCTGAWQSSGKWTGASGRRSPHEACIDVQLMAPSGEFKRDHHVVAALFAPKHGTAWLADRSLLMKQGW